MIKADIYVGQTNLKLVDIIHSSLHCDKVA